MLTVCNVFIALSINIIFALFTDTMRHILCLFLAFGLASCEDVKVKSAKGTIKGTRVDHDFGQYYYSFRGIRYAKPPTEELRFMVIRIVAIVVAHVVVVRVFVRVAVDVVVVVIHVVVVAVFVKISLI
jgi:hypothetical protein